jgi:hypothetical protein
VEVSFFCFSLHLRCAIFFESIPIARLFFFARKKNNVSDRRMLRSALATETSFPRHTFPHPQTSFLQSLSSGRRLLLPHPS